MTPPISSSPVSPPRDAFADELRGFALLGIVFVNAPFFALSAEGFSATSLATGLDRLAAWLTVTLAQAKFYLMFAFLFGYSLQYSVKDGSSQRVRRFRRRLLGLALIGVLHAVFLFVGDILMLYAVLGMGVLWLHARPDRVVLRAALIAATLWLALLGLLVIDAALTTADSPANEAARQVVQAFDTSQQEGDFWEAALARITFWPWAAVLLLTLNGPAVFALFCLGLLAARRHLLALPAAYAPLWRHGLRWGMGLGLPMAAISGLLSVGPGAVPGSVGLRETAGIALGFAAAPLLTWGYVAWLARRHLAKPQALAWFRSAGRMSLTVYIGESLLLSLIFASYGGGFFGQWGAAGVALCALLVWVLLVFSARLAQRRWQSGPLESLLRRFSDA